jgi:hypothetical protein
MTRTPEMYEMVTWARPGDAQRGGWTHTYGTRFWVNSHPYRVDGDEKVDLRGVDDPTIYVEGVSLTNLILTAEYDDEPRHAPRSSKRQRS